MGGIGRGIVEHIGDDVNAGTPVKRSVAMCSSSSRCADADKAARILSVAVRVVPSKGSMRMRNACSHNATITAASRAVKLMGGSV